jgi:iron complex outermembrane recepter protein
MGAFMRIAVLATALSSALMSLALADPATAAIKTPTNIAAQELSSALRVLAADRHLQILYTTATVANRRTSGAVGEFTVGEALDRLLGGTDLVFRYIDENTITIVPRGDADAAKGKESLSSQEERAVPEAERGISFFQRFRLAQATPAATDEPVKPAAPADDSRGTPVLDEVVVTGTQIRGALPSSPLVTITQEEMRLSGHANLGEVVRALPQNFSGGQNPGIGLGATGSNANYTGSSSLNLRGLGADATLTLLNGTRMPYDGIIQATDVSVIPVAAIDRMEILLDGASAIYGSDAVGGVANIILKRDYEGVAISARYGAATDGGFDQQQYNAVAGTTWSSGGFLATADLSKNAPVYARQRDFLSRLPNQGVTIFPDYEQRSALLSGHQKLGEVAELGLDAFYTDRDTHDIGQTSVIFDNERDSIVWGIAPAIRFGLPWEWSARLHGAIGQNENTNKLRAFVPGTGAELVAISPITKYRNKAETVGAGAEGPLFSLPGGEARLSVGAGYRNAEFDQLAVIAGTTVVGGDNQSHHAYGEINLPLLSRVIVNGALRYESYDSFGDVTTPKLGAIWKPIPSLDFKASWGKSFKAPTLVQQYQASALYLYPASFFPGLPPGTSVFYAGGGNPDIDPERAEVVTAGFVAKPAFLPGFSLEFGWFEIDYTDRVVQPIANLSQTGNPAYADFVTVSPSVAQQNAAFAAAGLAAGTFTLNATGAPYNPANIGGIVTNRFANVTADHASGMDVMARYAIDVADGRLAFTTNASWIDATRQLTSRSPAFDASGAIFFPAKFKGQLGTQWSRRGLTLTAHVNHIDGVENTNLTPSPKGASLTTVDFIADYRMETGPLGEMGLNLAVINLFDRAPPFLQASQTFFPPYDSTNYSALGRTIGATLTKQF